MLVFIIPIKSARVSSSWELVSKLFERTIKSVCNQTIPDFRVIIVCHEKPNIKFEHSNVTYIEVDFPIPTLLINMTSTRLDFIGIGVHKSATTWIAKCLEEHPNIRFSDVLYNKELYFFNRDDRYQLGYDWYHQGFEFGSWKIGEFSPLYFPDSRVPQRIYEYNPNIKLLLSLRNPIDRAFSHHLDEIRGGNLPKNKSNFWDALEDNPNYIELGKYASQLERYLECFESEQIYINLYDDIKSHPESILKRLFQFLDVDESYKPSTIEKKVNASHSYRIPQINNLIKSTSKMIRSVTGNGVAEKIKRTGVLAPIEKFNNVFFNTSITPHLSEEDRKRLQSIFADEIERLAILIGRDLSHWN